MDLTFGKVLMVKSCGYVCMAVVGKLSKNTNWDERDAQA